MPWYPRNGGWLIVDVPPHDYFHYCAIVTEYDLKPVKAPKLRGWSLRLVVAWLESPVFRPLLLPKLIKDVGIAAFRKQISHAAPTTLPLITPRDEPTPERVGADAAEAIALEEMDGASQGFSFSSITDYARAYRESKISPEEVARRIIEAVEASNQADPPLNGMIKWDAEDIRKQAAESADRFAKGQPRSVLEGVPVAIKDELDMPPYTTHVGTSFLGEEVPPDDATPVARLRAAGALLIGKANMHEIGICPNGNNPHHGFARNPYDPDYDTGGSSSGSGVAVGSGMVPLSIGADGGGSIRVPAAHCGVVGLKPTFGRVSEHGAAPLCWSVGHVGPLGATALDTAIGYAVCAGRDPKDEMSLKQPPVHLKDFHKRDLSGVTLGIYRPWFEHASPEVVANCRETVAALEGAGASVKEISIAGLEAMRMGHAITILTEMAAAMKPHLEEHRKDFAHATRLNLALAKDFSGCDYMLAQRIRTEALSEWDRVFSEVDVVLTPTSACPPPRIDAASLAIGESDLSTLTEVMRFVVCANFCGLPAISFPAGYTESGLPIGMQAIGRHWDEHLLLRLANVADQKREKRKPKVHYDILSQE